MRSITKTLVLNALFAAAATSLGAQATAPRRPVPAGPPARAEAQVRERVAARRTAMARERLAARRIAVVERQAARRAIMARRVRGAAAGPAFRAGVRAGARAGVRAEVRAGVRRDVIRARAASLTPAQRDRLRGQRQALQVEQRRIRDAVRAGTMTRAQAREQLRTWRQQHRPTVHPPGGPADGE
ncbi:MAG: hypothetical protein U9Q74_05230 [Gemmatimonadota bacterium]|nr:hypothetical protein [Gemmatimonadota bacterium]